MHRKNLSETHRSSHQGKRTQIAAWRPAVALALTFAPLSGQAQEAASGWDFALTPYLWMPSLNGDVSPGPRAPTLGVDASFSDLLDELEIGFMIAGSATKDRFGVFGDLQYFDFNSSASTPGPAFSSAVVDTDILIATLGPEYVALATQTSELRLAVGLRYYDVSIDGSLSAGTVPGREVSGGDDWFDGIIGLRGQSYVSEDWYVTGWAFVGGGGSDFTSDVFGGFGYRVSKTVDVVGGYRYFSVDREDGDGFVYDVEQHGLLIGVKFKL
ncbi:hypothetical protein [Ruegeria lacuscaerulensis]|uniref:hypothetical protein n=1 Tax=Ruegeria lacuscaerulensis TaxID=55218 RepID=UPI00147A15B1|nr:hypothetical protein [Ruegeria lacuscaerulensis]